MARHDKFLFDTEGKEDTLSGIKKKLKSPWRLALIIEASSNHACFVWILLAMKGKGSAFYLLPRHIDMSSYLRH